MSKQKFKTILQKINFVIGDDESMSALERDLIKSYLLKLYDLIDEISHGPLKENTDTPTVVSAESSNPSSENLVEETESQIEAPEEPKISKPRPAVPPLPHGEAQVLEHAEPITPDRTLGNGHKSEEIQTTPSTSEREVNESGTLTEVLQQGAHIPQRFAILFEKRETKELSEKLSRSPITDLHKVFSINDRMLVIADLFAGDQDVFADTIDVLNTKYSFEEAKTYLIRYVVERYDWLSDSRVEKAIDFIRLVERRYLDK